MMCVSFFYRLVIFTDLRDYKEDCEWHPEKPFPRRLIGIREGTIAAFLLIVFELFLTSMVGVDSLLAHLLPISWSLLMWREFFAGAWLARHPLFYAFIRAPVLALCGYSVGVTCLERSLLDFPLPFYLFGIANWAIFSLFQISSHTFGHPDGVNFNFILGRRRDCFLMIGLIILASAFGMNLWIWLGAIPAAVVCYLWMIRRNDFMTHMLHEVNFCFILYFYGVLSLVLVQ